MRSFLLVVPLIALCSTAHAQTADKSIKIGYIDMARALNEVEGAKQAKAQLKSDFDAKQKKLDKMQNDLKTKKEDFDKKASMMKPEARTQKQDELQKSFLDLQRTYMELQKELSEKEARITNEITDKLRRVTDGIGDRDGYALILNIGDTVVYYKRHLDITNDVIRDYNRQFPVKK